MHPFFVFQIDCDSQLISSFSDKMTRSGDYFQLKKMIESMNLTMKAVARQDSNLTKNIAQLSNRESNVKKLMESLIATTYWYQIELIVGLVLIFGLGLVICVAIMMNEGEFNDCISNCLRVHSC